MIWVHLHLPPLRGRQVESAEWEASWQGDRAAFPLSVPFPLARAWQGALEILRPWLRSKLGARVLPCSKVPG